MQIESIEKLIEVLYKAFPYSNQIKDLKIIGPTGPDADQYLQFTWRSTTYRITRSTTGVDEVEDGVLISSDKAMLIRELIQKEYTTGKFS